MKRDDMRGAVRFRRPSEGWGFAMVYHCVTEDPELTNSAFRLYVRLLKFAQQKDRCWPGVARVAGDWKVSDRTVERAMACLVKRGLVTRVRRLGTSSTTILEPLSEVYPEWQGYHGKGDAIAASEITPKEEEGKKKKIRGEDAKTFSDKPEGKEEALASPVQASSPEKVGHAALDEFLGPRVPRKPTGATGNWADPAAAGGGDAPAFAFVDTLALHFGMGGASALPAKKRWAQLAKAAEIIKEWGGATVPQAKLVADAYCARFGWRGSYNPYEKTFGGNVGALLLQARSGTLTQEGLALEVKKATKRSPAQECLGTSPAPSAERGVHPMIIEKRKTHTLVHPADGGLPRWVLKGEVNAG